MTMLSVKRPTQANPLKQQAVPVKPQRLTVDLDSELHRALKVQAAQESRTISEIIREACEQYIAERK